MLQREKSKQIFSVTNHFSTQFSFVAGVANLSAQMFFIPELQAQNQHMNKPLIITNQLSIQAPAAKVWDILVNPEQTKKYMFGCETVSDWKIGSELLWRGEYEGKQMDFVKGSILHIEKEKLLAYTVIDPNNPSIPDIPENYLTVTYTLTAENGTTVLTVTQGDYATVADGEKRYQESYNDGEGWNPILVAIKKIAEEKS